MNSQQQNYASMPFWEFIQSLDPNNGPGRGVDHNGPPFPGFPFGGPGHHGHHGPPGPPGPHGPHGPHGPPGPPPPGPGPHDADGDGFEWGPWFNGPAGPWAHHGRRGRHHGRFHRGGMNSGESRADDAAASASDAEHGAEQEKDVSPDTVRDDAPDPAEVAPEDEEHPHRPRGCGRGRGFGGRGRRGGCRGGGRGGFQHGWRFGPHHGPGAFPGAHPPPPHWGQGAPFDFGGFLRGCANHPFFQNLRDRAQQFQSQSNDDDSFTPPVDIFNTERAFILHVSLPGAKKEDIGVNWDSDNSVLNIAGVVHRPGDEEFLNTMTSSERKVGMFERNVTLPPDGSTERDEIDGFAISAKMEDGILIVTVPKVEKEWTEIHKIDIE